MSLKDMDEHEPGTSASTIRGLRHLDISLLSEPPSFSSDDQLAASPYPPASPRSGIHSEPGSPSGDSVSSFPSVSSSFLFSSGPATPPYFHPSSEPDSEGELGDSTSGLVIPSLLLPSPLRRPTPYGQTLGELRLLLLGPKGVDVSALAAQLVDDNEDVVEVGIWEEERRGKRNAVLRASTHWVEHRDAHGLERVEPARNIEIVELPSYDPRAEMDAVVESVLGVVHSPFYQVMDIVNREHPPSGAVAHLLSASSSPLHTALVLFASHIPSPTEKTLIDTLSPHIPLVLLPLYPHSDVAYKEVSPHLSSFRPSSLDALRTGLFRSPSTLAALRAEAAARFLRWREVERAVEHVQWGAAAPATTKTPMAPHAQPGRATTASRAWWDKDTWEAQWEGELSQEVALHLRRRRSGTARRITPLSSLPTMTRVERRTSYFYTSPGASTVLDTPMPRETGAEQGGLLSPPCPSAAFDPLHLPSLVMFSFSLFGALRAQVARSLGLARESGGRRRVVDSRSIDGAEDSKGREVQRGFGYTFGIGLALIGAFCAGVGIGLFVSRF
ncbi:hypothetical protein C8Q79DRAFT_1006099 [Trametes meyenii]|nr:hypothetical protein C8Q79DRAFT_1006099 [Trametes meyenii]